MNHRLHPSPEAAHSEWYSIVEGTSKLWDRVSPAKKELIRGFLNHVNMEIVKRARPPVTTFDYSSASIGNLFLTGARLFSGSFESAIYLFGSVCSIPVDLIRVIPAINSGFSHHISASLEDGQIVVGQNNISHPSAEISARSSPSFARPSLVRTGSDGSLSDLSDTEPYEENNLPGSLASLRKKNISFNKNDTQDLHNRITRIWYINPYGQEIRPPANPRMIDALYAAQTIIYSMGSLYTSIMPNLVLKGVGKAITNSPARQKILILNGSIDRETGPPSRPFTALDFIEAIVRGGEQSRGRFRNTFLRENSSNDVLPYTSYVTHILHLEGPGTPHVDHEALEKRGIKPLRLYGRKVANESGVYVGMKYDPAALVQALEVVLGKKADAMVAGPGKRSRRNTLALANDEQAPSVGTLKGLNMMKGQ